MFQIELRLLETLFSQEFMLMDKIRSFIKVACH